MDGGLGGRGERDREREREREGSVGLGLVSVVRLFGRSILRSAEFFFFSFLHSPLPPSVVSLASNHERHLRMRCRRRRRSFCFYSSLFLPLSLPLSLHCSLLPRISPVTSLPFPSSLLGANSVHDEIHSARNIADSSQNATITPFSAVKEEEQERRSRRRRQRP